MRGKRPDKLAFAASDLRREEIAGRVWKALNSFEARRKHRKTGRQDGRIMEEKSEARDAGSGAVERDKFVSPEQAERVVRRWWN